MITLLAFHELLHALILVLLEDGSNLGDKPFVDGDADDCQRYTGNKPCRLAKKMIDGSDTSQREEEGDGIKIDLQICSLHAEHGSLEYLQTDKCLFARFISGSHVGTVVQWISYAFHFPLGTWILRTIVALCAIGILCPK